MAPNPMDKSSINIGARLRKRRQELGMTLSDVADSIGVTKGFLSDVERDKTSPSVASLLRICDALNMPIGALFPNNDSQVIRQSERLPIKFGGIDIEDYLINAHQQSRFQAILSQMRPGGGGGEELYSVNAQEEFVFVLQGSVRITLEGETIVLEQGDTMSFNPRLPHTFKNNSDTKPAEALFIVSPPPRN